MYILIGKTNEKEFKNQVELVIVINSWTGRQFPDFRELKQKEIPWNNMPLHIFN
jgi:hypothetical protein